MTVTTNDEMNKQGRMPNLAWFATDGVWLVRREAADPYWADDEERNQEDLTPRFFPGVDRRWLEFLSAYNGAFQICGDEAEVMEGTKDELDNYILGWLQFRREERIQRHIDLKKAEEEKQRRKQDAEAVEREAESDLRWETLSKRHGAASQKAEAAKDAYRKVETDQDAEHGDLEAAAEKMSKAMEAYREVNAARDSLLAEAMARLAAGTPLDPRPAMEASAKRKAKEAAKRKAADERMVARWRAKYGRSDEDADAGERP